jgi:predicted DNA-binding transcriptional regulator AlpA
MEQFSLPIDTKPRPRVPRVPSGGRPQPPVATGSRVDLSHPLVDAEHIAAMLCVKRKRIYELARRPQDPLPSVRIGGAVRFVVAHVEDWVAAQAPH